MAMVRHRHPSTLSKVYIFLSQLTNLIKFHVKHHQVDYFKADWIGT